MASHRCSRGDSVTGQSRHNNPVIVRQGFSPELFDDDPGHAAGARAESTAPAPDPAAYPSILAIAADARARRPDATSCDEDFEFGFALDLILDGIERARSTGWTSPC